MPSSEPCDMQYRPPAQAKRGSAAVCLSGSSAQQCSRQSVGHLLSVHQAAAHSSATGPRQGLAASQLSCPAARLCGKLQTCEWRAGRASCSCTETQSQDLTGMPGGLSGSSQAAAGYRKSPVYSLFSCSSPGIRSAETELPDNVLLDSSPAHCTLAHSSLPHSTKQAEHAATRLPDLT